MKRETVIFDLDGTLLNTLEDLAGSMNRVLSEKGFPTHRTDAFRYFIGTGTAALVSRALPDEKRNDDLLANCLEAFLKDYSLHWNVKTKLYEGVPEMLDALTGKGVKIAVLSNKPDNFTQLCIREFFPRWKFDIAFGHRDGVPRKPDPSGALEIARGLDVPPQEIVYLGDSGVDMTTAVGAGMFPVGALWGFRTEKELKEHGAEDTIAQPMELLELMK